MASSDKTKLTFGLPDLSALTEAERLQVIAVMQRAKDFEMKEESKTQRKALEGQLTKFTNVMKGWQHRWFILDPESGMLEYFEKEEHKKQRPRGSVHLAAAVIAPSDEDSQTFTVSAANGEVYKLKAVDAKERQQWVDRLRATAEHHTAAIAQNAPFISRPEVRSASITNISQSASRSPRRHHSGSTENVHSTSQPSPVIPASSRIVHQVPKAPTPHPHTLDPFKEVKEYMMEAEDYAHNLHDRINTLPQTGEAITSLDRDLLLMKATSVATLQSLGQCLTMLQQRQEYLGHSSSVSHGAPVDVIRRHLSIEQRINRADSMPSPTGSFSSASSLPYALQDLRPTAPINHDHEEEDEEEYKDSELGGVEEHKSIILHLLSQLKLGMDLTKVVLPTFILEKRSLLELFADCMAHPDVFIKIPELPDPESRMIAVIEWYLTSFHAGRQGSVAKKPYNPIIGETFHCSWRIPPETHAEGEGNNKKPVLLTYCAEQVSHHPPVSAFYFECPEKRMCVNASIYTKSKFMGLSIGVVMVGKGAETSHILQYSVFTLDLKLCVSVCGLGKCHFLPKLWSVSLKLLDLDEEYVFSLPSAYARSILTVPWVELGDKVQFSCQKTNFSASVIFHTKPFYGGKLHKVTAEVKNGNTGSIVCKVLGEWNSMLEFTYADEETKSVDVTQIPIWRKRVRPLKQQGEFESRKLWTHVTNALKAGDINTATEHKKFLEERQREGERHRKDTNTSFPTQFFHKEGDTWLYNNMLKMKSEVDTPV